MPEDLPVYSEVPLRTGLQFAELDRLKGPDLSSVWLRADSVLGTLEGASGVTEARQSLQDASRQELLRVHAILFAGRTGAGEFRKIALPPIHRGQDCAPPEFIERSIDNMMTWLGAESFTQIHPIEQCALSLSRIIDLWPFDFGNLTTAIIFGNRALQKAGLSPFFIPPEHRGEFEKVLAQAMTIDMQPLVNAIFRTVKKEMEALAKR